MSTLKERSSAIEAVASKMNKQIYKDGSAKKTGTPKLEYQKEVSKVVTLEQAIKGSGLKDGMTISFHHHFRGGDKVVNLVVDKLAQMGFKNLSLAASSLQDVHDRLLNTSKTA